MSDIVYLVLALAQSNAIQRADIFDRVDACKPCTRRLPLAVSLARYGSKYEQTCMNGARHDRSHAHAQTMLGTEYL